MRTLLHIGQPKTGTTTLQRAFDTNRAVLEAHGILYPEDPNGRYENHRLLMGDLFPDGKVPRHILKNYAVETLTRKRQETRRSISRRVAECAPDTLLLSAESFFRKLPKSTGREFKRTIEKAANGVTLIEPIAYLRRPSSHYLSSLQQRLKVNHRVRRPGNLQLRPALESYEATFGKDRMHVVAFERSSLKDGDIVADFAYRFLGETGLSLSDLTRPEMTNESLSFESMDIVRRYRATFLADKADVYERSGTKLLRTLMEIETGLARDGSPTGHATVETAKPRLQPGISEMCDLASDQLLWLRDTYNIAFDGVDYSRLERGQLSTLPEGNLSLEEVVVIDRDIQDSLLQVLSDTHWARDKNASESPNAVWIEKLRRKLPKK